MSLLVPPCLLLRGSFSPGVDWNDTSAPSCAPNLLSAHVWWWDTGYKTHFPPPAEPAVWSLEQEQRLEESILVGGYSFSMLSAWSLLAFGKRMWFQVKAQVTQMHSTDGGCQLLIFVIIKSQQSFVCLVAVLFWLMGAFQVALDLKCHNFAFWSFFFLN